MTRIRWYGPSIVLLLTVIAVMFAGPSMVRQIAYAQTDANIKRIKNDLQQSDLLSQLSESYTQVAKAVEPSVVHVEILSRGGPQGLQGGQQLSPDDLRRWFFGPGQGGGPSQENGSLKRFGEPQPEPGGRGQGENFHQFDPPTPRGNGAGWVYDKQGHIITNNHVVAEADEIRVVFHDGTKRDASVVGTDPRTDVAVLKVDDGQLHPASVATEGLTQGQVIFAFGSPFRFDFSMSQGIVSALGRRLGITGAGGFERFIQTDAAVNPGNSGGPLVNTKGQVVGMNTAIASKTGTFNGIGFAIPSKLVVHVADQIINEGSVQRGYLGVYIEDLTPEMAQTFDFDGEGVLVRQPIKDSPADQAGLKAGDIITGVDGQDVQEVSELRFLIANMKPGQTTNIKVHRNGRTKTMKLTLGTLPDRAMARGGPTEQPGKKSHVGNKREAGRLALRKLGIEQMQTLSPALARKLPLDDDQEIEGVVLGNVRRGSIAANKGLSRGDLITAVGNEQVEDVDDLLDEINDHDLSKPIRFAVRQLDPRRREYVQGFIVVNFPQGQGSD